MEKTKITVSIEFEIEGDSGHAEVAKQNVEARARRFVREETEMVYWPGKLNLLRVVSDAQVAQKR